MADPTHIEARLLAWAEMLERAVGEVNKVMGEIKNASADEPLPSSPEPQCDNELRDDVD